MNNNIAHPKKSKELSVSFNFYIQKYEFMTFDIEVKGLLRDIEYSDKFFDWFMEDLIFFLEENGYRKRWDIQKINLHSLTSMELNPSDLEDFINKFSLITNWEMVAV